VQKVIKIVFEVIFAVIDIDAGDVIGRVISFHAMIISIWEVF